jgi:C-8 sterol isomerase
MGDDVFHRCTRLLWLTALGLIPVLSFGCGILPGTYVFDTEDLQEIASEVNATSGEEAVQQVEQALTARGYPIRTNPTWAINTSPGIPGQTAALYLYADEYLLVAGANSGAQWSMGSFVSVNIYDYVLYGDLQAYAADQLNPPVLGPGDEVTLFSGQALEYRTTNGVWVMEYGRGILPADLYPGAFASPFGFAQDAVLYAGGSFITSFIRNWVYTVMGIPNSIYSLLGSAGV